MTRWSDSSSTTVVGRIGPPCPSPKAGRGDAFATEARPRWPRSCLVRCVVKHVQGLVGNHHRVQTKRCCHAEVMMDGTGGTEVTPDDSGDWDWGWRRRV